jgi:pyridoxamine 5'-phosphate oxidase
MGPVTAPDPFALFQEWYVAAQRTDLPEPSAAALATVGADGSPSVRTVLVRGMDHRGFIFYTNLGSQKGRDLAERGAQAALCFYWPFLARQVSVQGTASRVSEAEADAYWATRERGSQVSAWASRQSEELKGGRPELEARAAEWDVRLPGENVPRPAFWSGFLIRPERIEFWEGRENRLHHRTLYVRSGDSWSIRILNP